MESSCKRDLGRNEMSSSLTGRLVAGLSAQRDTNAGLRAWLKADTPRLGEQGDSALGVVHGFRP
jgi:hypothetical protein